MILEMIIGGYFAAIGWMFANYTVDKIIPDKPPVIEKKVEEKKNEP